MAAFAVAVCMQLVRRCIYAEQTAEPACQRDNRRGGREGEEARAQKTRITGERERGTAWFDNTRPGESTKDSNYRRERERERDGVVR